MRVRVRVRKTKYVGQKMSIFFQLRNVKIEGNTKLAQPRAAINLGVQIGIRFRIAHIN